MTTATTLYNTNPLTLLGTERLSGDSAAGTTGGMLSQAIADLFKGTKGANIASATTTNIGAATGVFVHITGTTTITGLGTVAAGAMRFVTFDGALTLTYNATSLILPTAASITTAAGDSALMISEGSGNWRCLGYWRASGSPLGSVPPSDGDKGDITVSSSGTVWTIDSDVVSTIRSVPQNSQSAAYTAVLSDAGKHILHPSADTTARIFTIPANSSVAYPIGTALTFVNQSSAGTVTIAITTDTMRLAGAGSTGSRTLAANGIATALKITSTEWIISGTNLT